MNVMKAENEQNRRGGGEKKMRFCIVLHCVVGRLNGMLSICILFEIHDFVKHQIKHLSRHSNACTEHCERHSTVLAWEL